MKAPHILCWLLSQAAAVSVMCFCPYGEVCVWIGALSGIAGLWVGDRISVRWAAAAGSGDALPTTEAKENDGADRPDESRPN